MSIDKEKLLNSKNFCMAPWVTSHSFPSGEVFPCCTWNIGNVDDVGDLKKNSLKEIWNDKPYRDLRVDMLNNIPNQGCNRCYVVDKVNGDSYRNKMNRDYHQHFKYVENTTPDGHANDFNLHMWDFRISNICNFKCRSCSEGLSSSWHKDAVALGISHSETAYISTEDHTDLIETLEPHFEYVEEIYFAGGEPLLMKEHYQILQKLIDIGKTDVLIRYSTNFSILKYKDKHIFDYWKHFPNLELYISVDGIGEVGEYVRTGLKSQIFYNNVRNFLKSGLRYKQLQFVCTVGTLNLLHLTDMVTQFIENGMLNPNSSSIDQHLNFNPVQDPKEYCIAYLPIEIKQKFQKQIKDFIPKLVQLNYNSSFIDLIQTRLEDVLKFTQTSEYSSEHMNQLKKVTLQLDEIRNENFQNTIKHINSVEELTSTAEIKKTLKLI